MTNVLGFSLKSDKDKIASQAPTQRIVEITVKAPHQTAENLRTTMNLALIIDRSGSMGGSKLDYAKQAAMHVVELMGEGDRLSLVSFDNEVTIHASAVFVNEKTRQDLKNAILHLKTGGSTFLSGGWLAGCQTIASAQMDGGLNRALLLTDGQANTGIVDAIALGYHAGELNERGVSTTTLGVGLDFDHFLLERMAEMGGGNYYFIEDAQSIPAIFQKELSELIEVSARAVEIIVQMPDGVTSEVLGGWRTKTDDKGLHIMLGDLASDRQKEIFIKLLTPLQGTPESIEISARVFARDQSDGLMERTADLKLHYADEAEVDLAAEDKELMSRFAIVDNAEAANEALKLERDGENARASFLLNQRTRGNSTHLSEDQIREYDALSQRMGHGLNEADRKRSNYDANLRRKIRG